jgi:hypothetical protein
LFARTPKDAAGMIKGNKEPFFVKVYLHLA